MTGLIQALLFILRSSGHQGGHLTRQIPGEVPRVGSYAILAIIPGH
jgi:hypothetical protein